MSDKERKMIEEMLKLFQANQWCVTPEGIWGFLQNNGENVELENVVQVMQEQQAEGLRR